MKIICAKEKLITAINVVSKAVSNRTTLPILKCIMLTSVDTNLKLIANDMELGIETYIDCSSVESTGSIALEAKLFSEIVRSLPDEEVSIKIDNSNVCTIKSGRSEFKLMGESTEDFPILPLIEKQTCYAVSSDKFKNMIKHTSFAVALEETRPAFTGELFEIKDKFLSLVAVDGFRMAIRTIKFDNSDPDIKDISVIIPAKTLNEISKILPDDSEVKIYFTDSQALFEIDNTVVVSRLLTGEFIKYEQAFSGDTTINANLNRYELLSCLERAFLMSRNSGKKNPISIFLEGYILTIVSQTETGIFNEEILISNECDQLEISFNPKYLIDILKAIESDEIILRFSTSLSPCIVVGEDSTQYKYLALPLKLK